MDAALRTSLPADFDPATATWVHYGGGPRFDYPIDYSVAVVEADAAAGRIDFLVRWAPGAYCHHHRHLGTTEAVVIEGEQHLTQERPFETVTKVRTAGFAGPVPHGETHMERAGADGLTMLFSTLAPDGRLFEVLGDDDQVIATATIAEFLDRLAADAA